MANLPHSFFSSQSFFGVRYPEKLGIRSMSIEQLLVAISDTNTREYVVKELSKRKDKFPDLGPILWQSCGTIAAFLQEVTLVYPFLSPPILTDEQSNRICDTLALLQCVAAHTQTRGAFLLAQIPVYVYPFLDTTERTRPFEQLRLSSLGVIGSLVKEDSPEVANYLLTAGIIPLCLKNMEISSELSKTVSIFIVHKILLHKAGLDHICSTLELLFSVIRVLARMVSALVERPSARLLKHIIRCYLLLSENSRACDVFRRWLPAPLMDGTFSQYLMNDEVMRGWLQRFVHNLQQRMVAQQPAAGHGPSVVN